MLREGVLIKSLLIYEQTGVVVTVISLPVLPHAAYEYISLTLKYFEVNLMMATSGRNM
jgi:predicted ATP-grasp superfamily ATP-dependent carboligase